jgi:predicted MFS family arabinose efflux permease
MFVFGSGLAIVPFLRLKGATGTALGGIMAQCFWWRAAFFFVGIPGLLFGTDCDAAS